MAGAGQPRSVLCSRTDKQEHCKLNRAAQRAHLRYPSHLASGRAVLLVMPLAIWRWAGCGRAGCGRAGDKACAQCKSSSACVRGMAPAAVHCPGRPQAPHGAGQQPLDRQVLLANPMWQCTPYHLVNGRAPMFGLVSSRVELASARLGNLDVAAAQHRAQGRPCVMRLLLLPNGHTLPCAAGAVCTRFSHPPPCRPSCPKPHLACSDSPLL